MDACVCQGEVSLGAQLLWTSIGVSGSLQSLQEKKKKNKTKPGMCQFSDVTTAATTFLSPFIQSVGKDVRPTSHMLVSQASSLPIIISVCDSEGLKD